MNDDIVQRLRSEALSTSRGGILKAADEIERLRAELDKAKQSTVNEIAKRKQAEARLSGMRKALDGIVNDYAEVIAAAEREEDPNKSRPIDVAVRACRGDL